ncbi:hypothetical protein E2C01_066795 [Portunus trituberculatus]|uniref:Uncharacterized protein n=1 Tax=Portunus trituberculatus TaxID=210409 RepID=A0A5B7HRN6_PORTR|nr:hypothetical protein [Portunus trituberculatus]
MSVGVCSLVTLRYVSGLRCLRTAVSQRPLHTCSAALGIAKLPAGSHTIPDSRAQVSLPAGADRQRLFAVTYYLFLVSLVPPPPKHSQDPHFRTENYKGQCKKF